MTPRHEKIAVALIVVAALLGCAYYDLDVEGKQCNDDHPCPTGYSCSPSADGGSTCRKSAPDGGVDGGDQACTEGEKVCAGSELATCRNGSFDPQACDGSKYCFDAGGAIEANCVAPCASSSDCTALHPDYYCDVNRCVHKGSCADNYQPDVDRCNLNRTKVVRCDGETGEDLDIDTCVTNEEYCDPFDPECKPFCDDDLDCGDPPGSSCDLSERKCIPMGYCGSDADCDEGICVEPEDGVCVKMPDTQVWTHGGAADLGCFEGSPTPPMGPATCDIEGPVVEFFSRSPLTYRENIVVSLLDLQQILQGTVGTPLFTTDATDNAGDSFYSFTSVPTNTAFVVDVHCDPSCGDPNTNLYPMYTFVYYARADDCEAAAGTLTGQQANAILESNYLGTYSSHSSVTPPIDTDPDLEKGLVIGWVTDCSDNKVWYATGGVSMANDLLYYIPSGPPDYSLTSTTTPGLFAAVNALPVRGMASALVLDQASTLSLWNRPIRVFPATATFVIFDRPDEPRP